MYDHGTAVAGIIGAEVNGSGVAGVIPGVKIWNYKVITGTEFSTDGDPMVVAPLSPAVVNISTTYALTQNDELDALSHLLLSTPGNVGYDNTYLLVAAAGAEDDPINGKLGQEVNDLTGCVNLKAIPACWSRDDRGTHGLISVVALNADGTAVLTDSNGHPLSNYGQAFDVAAVGTVQTALYGNSIGTVTGSSFATPYVSGLAALLFAKTKVNNLNPSVQEVKNRILFTADTDDTLSKSSRFGRINFKKALDFKEDLVSTLPCDNSPCWQHVKIDRNSKDAKLTITSGESEDGQEIQSSKTMFFSDIKAIIKRDDTYLVRYMETNILRQIKNATIEIDPSAHFVMSNKQKLPFSLNISEFVSCSFYKGCGENACSVYEDCNSTK